MQTDIPASPLRHMVPNLAKEKSTASPSDY